MPCETLPGKAFSTDYAEQRCQIFSRGQGPSGENRGHSWQQKIPPTSLEVFAADPEPFGNLSLGEVCLVSSNAAPLLVKKRESSP